jgi:hypothetical protein
LSKSSNAQATQSQTFSFNDFFSVSSYTGPQTTQSVDHTLNITPFDTIFGNLLQTQLTVSANSQLSETILAPQGGGSALGPNITFISNNSSIDGASPAFNFQSFNSTGSALTGANITASFVESTAGGAFGNPTNTAPVTVPPATNIPVAAPMITLRDGITYGEGGFPPSPVTISNLQETNNVTATLKYIYNPVNPITLADVLDFSVHPSIITNGNGGQGIQAIFEPQKNYSLSQTVALANQTLGTAFTHFNWIQYLSKITYPTYQDLYNGYLVYNGGDPVEAKAFADQEFADQQSLIPYERGPGYDPLLGGNPNPFNNPIAPCAGDFSIAFWDETPKSCPGLNQTTNASYLVQNNTVGDGQLTLVDYPSQVIPLTELTFDDVLAGVDAFGNVTPLYYGNTEFQWIYTENLIVPNGHGTVSLYGNNDPSLGGAGTVTWEFTNSPIPAAAPEPAALTMLATALLGILPFSRHRRRPVM